MGIVMSEVDRKVHLAGYDRWNVWAHFEHPYCETHGVSLIPHRFLQGVDNSNCASQSIATDAAWRCAGMALLADDFDAKGALALDPSDDACGAALLLKGYSLLNVSLQKAHDREAQRSTRNVSLRVEHASESGLHRGAGAILDGQDVCQLSPTGEHRRAHHARGEAGAFFVHPRDDVNRPAWPVAKLGHCMYCLQRGQHPVSTIELATGRLAVDMRPDQQWREPRLAASQRQEQVCRGIDGRFEADALCPCKQRGSGLDLFIGQSQPTNPTLARRTEFGEIHQTLPKAVLIDALGDPGNHCCFLPCAQPLRRRPAKSGCACRPGAYLFACSS